MYFGSGCSCSRFSIFVESVLKNMSYSDAQFKCFLNHSQTCDTLNIFSNFLSQIFSSSQTCPKSVVPNSHLIFSSTQNWFKLCVPNCFSKMCPKFAQSLLSLPNLPPNILSQICPRFIPNYFSSKCVPSLPKF